MSLELVVERSPFGLRAGLLEEGRLLEVSLLDEGRRTSRAMSISAGCARSTRVWTPPSSTAASARTLISVRAMRGSEGIPRCADLAPAERRAGVLVQVRRDAAGGKRPRLTTDVALVGLGLVYRPRQRATNLSARLARTTAAAAQRARARAVPTWGITFRLGAEGSGDAELAAEAARLEDQWARIQTAARTAAAPARLHTVAPLHRLLLEQLTPDLGRIVADPPTLAGIRTWLAEWHPPMVERLARAAEPFAASGAAEQLEEALQPRVALAAGGALIIQPTAALTAIDVDGGGRRVLEVNLDASREIARQLRLRRIGGTVVVDYIDLAARSDRVRVVEELRRALADDPAPVQAFPPSRLGLVEISRKRTGPSLAEALGRRCPVCGGDGVLAGLRRRAERLMAELDRRRARVEVHVAPDLEDFLRGAGAAAWRTFTDRHGTVPIAVDRSLDPGGHRIAEPAR